MKPISKSSSTGTLYLTGTAIASEIGLRARHRHHRVQVVHLLLIYTLIIKVIVEVKVIVGVVVIVVVVELRVVMRGVTVLTPRHRGERRRVIVVWGRRGIKQQEDLKTN